MSIDKLNTRVCDLFPREWSAIEADLKAATTDAQRVAALGRVDALARKTAELLFAPNGELLES